MQNVVRSIQIEIADCVIEFLPKYCSLAADDSFFIFFFFYLKNKNKKKFRMSSATNFARCFKG